MANKTSEKLSNFEVYDGVLGRLLGLADVELPTIEYLSETISGAGIAGEIDSPTLGHVSAMAMTLKFRVHEPEAIKLLAPKAHALDLRGGIQRWNGSTGEYEIRPLKIVTRCVPKSGPLGTLAPGAMQEPTIEFSVKYIKEFLDGKALLEIDPNNYICVIDGVDYLADLRTALGL